ncbi:signal recognition particle protein [Thermogymnomonas acidicola]|uniref:Signal recognition particle 54 kDa protein n=1 Tax=Thermogymnomonas acidicola TaxID=399579 RepID=A0AA37BQV8_9ARCH|nr:signal recognition particle protein Srp54 [Thermogymnomonas acidicola]GGM71796.1 signal recognition particle protein [Thermogymnomonas acidicola]
MVLDNLATSLRETIRKISNSSYIDRETVREVVRDVQRALLKADVNVRLALELTKKLEKRAMEEKPPAGMAPQDFMIKIIYEELLSILGEPSTIKIRPQKIMLVGLYGQGKTTSAGKLARFFSKKGLNVGLIAADVHRPAAYEQLEQISKQLSCGFFGIKGEKDPVKIVQEGLRRLEDFKVKIVDTSGRDSLDMDLIEEIKRVKKAVEPDEVLLVMDATVGQQAGPQAKAMNDAVGITGVIITKMDGTGKGGGALSAVAEIRAPVFFIGTGEHLDDFEIFNPTRFLSRLLGLGDLESLMEAVQEANITEEEAEESFNKLMSGKFNLKDMYDVWEKFAQPGLLRRILDNMPLARSPLASRVGQADIEGATQKLQRYRVILDSMTFEELENPDILNSKRIQRVARGSGRPESEVRELLREYKAMKNNLKMLKGNRGIRKLMRAQFRNGNFSLDDIIKGTESS